MSLEGGTLAAVTGSPNGSPGEVTLRTGERVLIRPVRPSDKSLLIDGLERMSTESRYKRFFSPIPRLGASQLRYLTEVDHHNHEALVAVEGRSGAVLGVARFIRSEDDPQVAESAVAVVDDWQGRGLGTELHIKLAERAREEGIRRFSASVLAANARTLDLLRDLGDVEVIARHDAVVDLVIDLPEEGTGDGLRHAVRAAASADVTVEPRHPT